MPKLPTVSAAELTRALGKIGFTKISQKGSHIKMRDKTGRIVVIPNHPEIKKGTLKKGILNPLGINVDEFLRLLKNK